MRSPESYWKVGASLGACSRSSVFQYPPLHKGSVLNASLKKSRQLTVCLDSISTTSWGVVWARAVPWVWCAIDRLTNQEPTHKNNGLVIETPKHRVLIWPVTVGAEGGSSKIWTYDAKGHVFILIAWSIRIFHVLGALKYVGRLSRTRRKHLVLS